MAFDYFSKRRIQYFLEKIKSKIPTKLSELTADSTHRTVTDTEKTTWNNKSNFSGSYTDLSNKPTIPTKVSQLTNDSGYTTNTGTVTQVKVGTTAYNPSSGVVSLPAYPTDTWRGIQDNLTSDSTTDSLSAKQGHVLNQRIIDYEDRGYLGKNKFINSLPVGYTKTINGITFTVNDDYSITVNGTASAQVNAYVYGTSDITDSTLKPYYNNIQEGCILSGCPSGGSETSYLIVAGSLSSRYGTDIGNGAELTNFSNDGMRVIIQIASGVTVNNLVFKPMIRNAGADDVYESYVKSNIELDNTKLDKTDYPFSVVDGKLCITYTKE